jgi:hypothetical protein
VPPVYATLPGWSDDITTARAWGDLPENARRYVDFLSEQVGVPVSIVSVGPERQQTIPSIRLTTRPPDARGREMQRAREGRPRRKGDHGEARPLPDGARPDAGPRPRGAGAVSARRAPPDQLPRHVAIIMDGNGRWAQNRGPARIFGHRRGIQSVRAVVEEGCRIGLDQLTLYCLSVENWKRRRAS